MQRIENFEFSSAHPIPIMVLIIQHTEESAVDLFSMEFVSALSAIVVIDLVLAGDNAIVIALAARGVPVHMRKRVILWGTFGAIAVRSSLTVVVVWLLNIPGLMLGGGALLLWIAYRLLIPDDESTHGGVAESGTSFLSAMRTIIVADTVMGLDNVLAVAGAAHGSYLLVGLGLAISVPIVIWGSTLVLRFVERHPWTVYAGAGVLAFTAVKMITHDAWLNTHVEITARMALLLYLLLIPGVLWLGFMRNHRQLESRVHARLAAFDGRRLSEITGTFQTEGDDTMRRVLIPVDGTKNADAAVRHVLNQFMADTSIEIHLLNVQAPLSRHIGRFVARRDASAWHREQSDRELAPARAILEQHRVPYIAHTGVGERATEIAATARRLRCEHIVIGAARRRSFTRMFEDSVTDQVLDLTDIPVELVAGEAVSRLERFGVPAGIGAALALLLLAGD